MFVQKCFLSFFTQATHPNKHRTQSKTKKVSQYDKFAISIISEDNSVDEFSVDKVSAISCSYSTPTEV